MSNETAVVPARRRIGGWLILPAIGLVAAPIAEIVSLVTDIKTLPTAPAGFAALIMAETVMAAGMLALDLVVAVVFFQRKATAPKLVIAWLVARLLVSIVDYVWLSTVVSGPQATGILQDVMSGLLRTVAATVFWASYFRRSVRVQQTFDPPPEAVAVA